MEGFDHEVKKAVEGNVGSFFRYNTVPALTCPHTILVYPAKVLPIFLGEFQ